jgi:hypothetical protein
VVARLSPNKTMKSDRIIAGGKDSIVAVGPRAQLSS